MTVSIAFLLLFIFVTSDSSAELDHDPSWESSRDDDSYCVAWGDFDNDGDLDLAASNYGPNHIYENRNGTLETDPIWESTDNDDTAVTHEVMWGDIDGNGWLDLVAVNGAWGAGYDVVYLNWGGVLSTTANWTNSNSDHSAGMDLGDFDGDGDLDLVTANYNGRECIYENVDGMFTTTPVWESYLNDDGTQDAEFLDVDGDEDLDLYFGCSATMDSLDSNADAMYFNDPGLWGDRRYGLLPDWSANNELWTTTVKAGDIDGDGDPDIIAANGYNNNNIVVMYENTGSTLDRDYSWNIEVNWPYSCALGDVDQDDWLDVAIASYNEKVYLVRNEEGTLGNDYFWESSDVRRSYRCDWGDIDNDTFPELAVANYNTTSHPGNNVVYANEIMKPTVTIFHPEEGQEVRGRVTINGMANGTLEFDLDRVEVSLDSGSSWIVAVGTDEWSYQWNSSDWEDGEYAIMTRAIAGPLVSEHAVVNVTLDNPENRAPTLEFISPPAGGDTTDMSYIIQWIVQDEDGDPVSMDLYYDEDSDSGNGKEFLASLEGDVDEYVWDTRETAEGEYYISIVADDKNGSVVERYSQGTIRIEHASSSNHDPEIEIVSITNLQDGFMEIRWEATDADEDELLIDISYDDDTMFGNGVDLIMADIENTGEYDLDTTAIPEGDHYFVLVARDPNGGTAVAYSEQFHVNETRVVPEFSVVELVILPAGAVFTVGDLVTIQTMVTNTKDVDGQGQVSLIVDNVTVQTKTEMIRYDKEVTVLFMWTAVEGNHTITVLVDFPDDPTYRPHGLSTRVLVGTADQGGDKDDNDEITTLLIGSTIGVIAVVVLVVFFVGSKRSEPGDVRCPMCGENTTYYREYDDHYCDGCEEYTSEMDE